jgi:hypothetical protein
MIVNQSLHETSRIEVWFFPVEDGTETRSVMGSSVVASVDGRNRHRHHLSLFARQWTGAPHDLDVEIVVLPHDPGMNTVDLDDVVAIQDSVGLRNVRF